MPTLAISDAQFSPSYIPVAVFVGGISGVGQAMAEALARQLEGHIHITLIGKSAQVASEISAGFPKPLHSDEWKQRSRIAT